MGKEHKSPLHNKIDIESFKASNEELKLAVEKAYQASQVKSQFLANMSHEIRTPLNSIIGLTDVLLETQLNKEQEKFLKVIQNSGETLLNIINDILDLSKIESGHMEIENIPFDLEELIEQVTEIMALSAHEKSIDLVLDLATDVPTQLYGDPLRLRQIIYNLLGNAIKFTKQGAVSFQAKIDSNYKSDQCFIHFCVSDTGVGIPSQKLKTIFDSFTQADSSTTRQFGGTGLGLNIVKNLIENMGGKIWVESQVNQGSKFNFIIPFKFDEDWRLKQSRIDHLLSNKQVLIVDDCAQVQTSLANILKETGCSTTMASTAKEALKVIKYQQFTDRPIDLIFIDCRMPSLGGFELVEQIKTLNLKKEVPVVLLLTSDYRNGDLLRAKELGIKSHLIKPLKKNEVNTTVRNVFSRPSKGNLLIVDDDKELLEYLKEAIEPLDLNLKLALSCEEATTILNKFSFDAILCDVHLPKSSGIDFYKHLKSLDDNTPFILFSGDPAPHLKDQVELLNPFSFIHKPFSPEKLLKTVCDAIKCKKENTHNFKNKEEKSQKKKIKLLVAEDSAKNQELLKVYLKDQNIKLIIANDGAEGLKKVKGEKFDLILMDMQMPLMDGYTAVKEIRKWEVTKKVKQTPIIALTAFALKEEREKSLKVGCNDHLSKPIKKKLLLQSIENNLKDSA